MVNFFEHQFPDMLDIPSTARSPQQMFGAIAKNYWAEKMNIPREDLIVVSIMPCLAKKYECAREEFATQGDPDVNYSLSTRELASLIKRANIDFNSLADEDFDHIGELMFEEIDPGRTTRSQNREAYVFITLEITGQPIQ